MLVKIFFTYLFAINASLCTEARTPDTLNYNNATLTETSAAPAICECDRVRDMVSLNPDQRKSCRQSRHGREPGLMNLIVEEKGNGLKHKSRQERERSSLIDGVFVKNDEWKYIRYAQLESSYDLCRGKLRSNKIRRNSDSRNIQLGSNPNLSREKLRSSLGDIRLKSNPDLSRSKIKNNSDLNPLESNDLNCQNERSLRILYSQAKPDSIQLQERLSLNTTKLSSQFSVSGQSLYRAFDNSCQFISKQKLENNILLYWKSNSTRHEIIYTISLNRTA